MGARSRPYSKVTRMVSSSVRSSIHSAPPSAQSGQPWEAWSYEPYISLTTSTSDTARLAEPAGSRRTDGHWQLDLNYTQNLRLGQWINLQIAADFFNVNNRQTGYNYQPSVHDSTFNTPRDYYDPRRFQLAARFRF